MSCDLPYLSYMALYLCSVHIIQSNTRSATHWKLNLVTGRVQPIGDGEEPPSDPHLNILTGVVSDSSGNWKVESAPETCTKDCVKLSGIKNNSKQADVDKIADKKTTSTTTENVTTQKKKKNLNCGKSPNITVVDGLKGVAERVNHPYLPESHKELVFQKKGGKGTEVNLAKLEKDLKKAVKTETKKGILVESNLYNQIGNFWRLKGDTQTSIECFRKSLSLTPQDPDTLLNLARLLFSLNYLEDAILLTRKSLDLDETWIHHFTLAEILRAYGHNHDAMDHFRLALEMNPGFEPAELYLTHMEAEGDQSMTLYTVCIILCLMVVVAAGLFFSIKFSVVDDGGETVKTQRHFNRAMAMRSIKMGINHKLIRMRKQCSG